MIAIAGTIAYQHGRRSVLISALRGHAAETNKKKEKTNKIRTGVIFLVHATVMIGVRRRAGMLNFCKNDPFPPFLMVIW
ncbi:MAG: hypothetical protein ACLVJX_07200 [Merdibacter sp.]